jgi:YjbE family integral membrane protein
MQMEMSQTLPGLIEIVWLDLILSGDNAVLLALATRALPVEQRRAAVMLGTLSFILARVGIAFALLTCAGLPGIGFLGAAVLIWAALALAMRPETPERKAPRRSLSAALLACLAADAPVALQNMTAVQAAAGGARPLVLFGLALSIPLLALGSAQFITVLRKPPILWAGAALLGWIAGKMAATDALVLASPMPPALMADFAPPVGAVLAALIVFVYLGGRHIKRVPQE